MDGSETLTATVAPDNATNKKVTWKSDKPEIATVDASGKITGVKEGEATITVTTEDGGKTATCKVTVEAATIAVTGVTLNKTELSYHHRHHRRRRQDRHMQGCRQGSGHRRGSLV